MSRPAPRPEHRPPQAEAALADLSAVMQRAVSRMQEKRATVERLVAEPTTEQDDEERPAAPRAVR